MSKNNRQKLRIFTLVGSQKIAGRDHVEQKIFSLNLHLAVMLLAALGASMAVRFMYPKGAIDIQILEKYSSGLVHYWGDN